MAASSKKYGIDYESKGSFLNPLKNLQFFGRPPVTEPLEPRPASINYRGFHLNDWEKCIGCGTCQRICDNAAITMVKVPSLPEDETKGIRNLRPAIDYGRCCWCALCVDVCPTASISLSREYVHTCVQEEIDSYFILPDPHGMHNQFFGHGWQKTDSSDLLDHQRVEMEERAAESRSDNFDEIVEGYSVEQAIAEASRCVQCGMCHDACPAHMHAPEYIKAIWEQDFEEAVRQIYRTNPFAHTCGRVCTHRCETACSIGVRGEPIAIRWLKRFAMDQVDHNKVKQIAANDKVTSNSGKKVAVIGAGPAGLTAAYDLALQGHQVEVFEKLDKPGGMTRYGIPEYRLPYDMLDRDVEVITSLGVKIHYNTTIGNAITMAQLQKDFDAVVMAIGLQNGRSTRVPNADHTQVKRAVDLLQQVTNGTLSDIPKSAVVIGGGNVAMDIARSMARLQKQHYGESNVTVTALEQQQHFLADPEEIKESLEEGITILDSCGPQGCEIDAQGKLVGLKTWRVISIFDENHRFSPQYDETDEKVHHCDMIIEAIGQFADYDPFGVDFMESLEWDRGRPIQNEEGRTTLPWLWVAGDCVNGPDVVHAVADGHRVANSIHRYLAGGEKAV